jgi:hypothetical protein
MTKVVKRLSVWVLAIAAAAVPMVSQAAFINGTFGFIPFLTSGTFTGSNLGSATSITFAANPHFVNNLPPTSGGSPNDFNATNGVTQFNGYPIDPSEVVNIIATPLSLSGIGASPVAVSITDFFTFGAGRFHFDLTTLSRTSSGANNIATAGTGVIRDTLGAFSTTAAAFSMNGGLLSGNAFNYSFSVASASPVPLPAALPLLFAGLGLFGFTARRRRAAA